MENKKKVLFYGLVITEIVLLANLLIDSIIVFITPEDSLFGGWWLYGAVSMNMVISQPIILGLLLLIWGLFLFGQEEGGDKNESENTP